MARMSQKNTSLIARPPTPHQHPGVWIQYKGPRARVLQTTKVSARSASLTANIEDEFRADLEALKLNVPGVPLEEIKVVWGTGQVRATYGIQGNELREIVKHLVGRTRSTRTEMLSERSIARIWYAEDGTPFQAINSSDHKSSHGASSALSKWQNNNQTAEAASSVSQPLRPPSGSLGSQRHGASLNVAIPGIEICTQSRSSLQPYGLPTTAEHRNSLAEIRIHPDGSSAYLSHSPRGSSALAPVILGLFSTLSCIDTSMVLSDHSPAPQAPQILPPIHLGRDRICESQPLEQPPLPEHQLERNCERPQSSPMAPAKATYRTQHLLSLTPGTCTRLRHRSDDEVLSSGPVVRVLVLREMDGTYERRPVKAYRAFVTDGSEYAWMALSSSLNERIGDRDDRQQLQVGSAVKLVKISRLHAGATCIGLIHGFEIVECEVDARPGLVGSSAETMLSPKKPGDDLPESAVSRENRASRLLAEMKLQEERRRRILLEGVLADVCRDLDSKGTLPPAVVQALKKIEELTDVAMLVD